MSVTEEPELFPGCFLVHFYAQLVVECEFDPEQGPRTSELQQAVRNEIGFTGVECIDVTCFQEIP